MERSSQEQEEVLQGFDPNGIGRPGLLFGVPVTQEKARFVVLPVPWDVTVSDGEGAAYGPAAVLEASPQIDLYDEYGGDIWLQGISMLPISEEWFRRGQNLRSLAKACIRSQEILGATAITLRNHDFRVINDECARLNRWVREQSRGLLSQGKIVGVLGGDHSAPLGLMKALASAHRSFGILHFDAHFDLRKAYEGFIFSHASIIYNALKVKAVERIVHVGVRDFCDAEHQLVTSDPRCIVFTDRGIKHSLFKGGTWKKICERVVDRLPNNVYVSFDIDCLQPSECPNTGTPVVGGLEFEQAMYLVERVVERGKTIIGFDLCEVAPSSRDKTTWGRDLNAKAGTRILYRLANYALMSQQQR